MKPECVMLALIRSEMLGKTADDDITNGLTDEALKELYVVSKKHDLSHIIASALSKKGRLRGDEISAKFDRQKMIALYRDGQRGYALGLLSSVLEAAGIAHMPLKGSVLCQYYPHTWMRTSCDVDVLINSKDVLTAEKALCEAGFRRDNDKSTHDYNFTSPNDVHIELHYTLTQDGRVASSDSLLESVWEDYALPDKGTSFRYMMTPELFTVYHLAHMGRHLIYGGCGVRPFIDLWLINGKLGIDQTKLGELLEKSGLHELYRLSSDLAEVWLEGRDHTEDTALLESFILSGGVYGNADNAASVRAARGMGKLRSFFSMVFLPRKNLQVIYPKLEKYPILLPFYQIKRWFGVFNKDKRRRVKRLYDARDAVTDESEDKARALLDSLGLNK